MHDEPVDLDARRGRAGLIETEKRRKSLHDLGEDTVSDEPVPEEPVPAPLAEPIASWVDAASKARYLLRQYARTREGQIPAQARLIEQTLGDLADLVDRARADGMDGSGAGSGAGSGDGSGAGSGDGPGNETGDADC